MTGAHAEARHLGGVGGHGRALTVRPTGELDAYTAPVLRRRLAEVLETGDDVVVDLSAVTLLGAAGGRVLVDAQRRAAHERRARVHLVGPTPPVARVLRLLGVPSSPSPEPPERPEGAVAADRPELL